MCLAGVDSKNIIAHQTQKVRENYPCDSHSKYLSFNQAYGEPGSSFVTHHNSAAGDHDLSRSLSLSVRCQSFKCFNSANSVYTKCLFRQFNL